VAIDLLRFIPSTLLVNEDHLLSLDVVLGVLCRHPMKSDITVSIATIADTIAKALNLPISDKVEMYCDGKVSTNRLCAAAVWMVCGAKGVRLTRRCVLSFDPLLWR